MAKIKMPGIERKILSGHIANPVPPESSAPVGGKVIIFESWCKRCGICSHFCPTGALEVTEEGLPYLAHPDKCTLCGMCWNRCPDLAIVKGKPENGNHTNGKKKKVEAKGGENG